MARLAKVERHWQEIGIIGSASVAPVNDQICRTHTRHAGVTYVCVTRREKVLVWNLRHTRLVGSSLFFAVNAGSMIHGVPAVIIRHDFCSFVIWRRNAQHRCANTRGCSWNNMTFYRSPRLMRNEDAKRRLWYINSLGSIVETCARAFFYLLKRRI